MVSVFCIGGTGCIGGSVLTALRKAHPHYTFKVLARDTSVVNEFNTLPEHGASTVEAVKGSLADHNIIARLTYESDLVINTADSDSVDLRDALLEGFKRRFDEGKPPGSFIHTSGTRIFAEGPKGGTFDPNAKIWTDGEEDVRALNETQVHGQFDVPILKAQEEGYLNAFIICPTIVHGTGGGPLKRPSVAFKLLMSDAVERKRAAYIGEGTILAGFVHVDDLVNLYLATFQQLIDAHGKKLESSPYERYLIATRESFKFRTVFTWVAAELFKLGKIESSEPVSISYDQASPTLARLASQNRLCRAGRAFTLGWQPYCPTIQETLAEDLRRSVEFYFAS